MPPTRWTDRGDLRIATAACDACLHAPHANPPPGQTPSTAPSPPIRPSPGRLLARGQRGSESSF